MNNFFTFSTSDISTAVILFNLILASLISLSVAIVYRKTHSGLSYSQSFFTTVILMAPIAMIIIVVVQNNIYGALGLLGAFSLIRFRTIVKETRDITFLFFSLVEGVVVGSGHYTVAIISTIFISILAIILFKLKFGSVTTKKHILMLVSPKTLIEDKVKTISQNFGVELDLLSLRKIDDHYEYAYSSHSKNIDLLQSFLAEINKEFALTSFDLISGKDTVEY